MNRKAFLQKSLGASCCAWLALEASRPEPVAGLDLSDRILLAEDPEQVFIQNWLSDLLEAMEAELDEPARIRLVEACGRACFRRFSFKQELARQGAGDVDRLVEALRHNFEVWREGDRVHLRYGEVSPGCYCPAAKYRPARPDDLHCHCSRASHQAIWEAALGRPFRVEIAESVRRGGKTCHFVVHLA